MLGTLVVSNVMANQVLPAWAYIPWNCSVAAVLVRHRGPRRRRQRGRPGPGLTAAPRRAALGRRGLGRSARRSTWSGSRCPRPATCSATTGPTSTPRALLWRTLVAIPLGTVLMEEVAFRGVLPAMFRRRTAHTTATARCAPTCYAALLFGVWHVLPSLDLTEANPVFHDLLPGPLGVLAAIAGGVVGTAAAGMGLSWLRNRSGSLAAPAMVHISSNSIGYVLAWLVQR